MMRSRCTTLVAFLVISLVMISQSLAETMEHHTTRVRRAMSSILSESADDSVVPITGLLFPTKTSSDSADYMSYSAEKELIDALEMDDQVTVVGEIQIGVLDCDSLEKAEDTTRLQVAIRPDEVITAERTSYTYLSGGIFEDGVARKVWIGEEVVDDAKDPLRTVSITWGEVCNVETFLLKVTSPEEKEGALSVVKTIPCITGAITELCVVETEVSPKEEDEPDPATKAPVDVSHVQELGKTRSLRPTGAKSVTSVRGASGEKRQLQSTTMIEVMYLYTKGVKEVLGDISDIQVQTTIAAAIATTNQAMNNSMIDLEISPVHVGSLPYNETSTSSSTVLDSLEANEDVADMRDTYEADLVQLVANLGFTCGRANLYTGSDTEAFSTVNPICFDYLSHTHEMAHNLGCYHNRDNSNAQTDYAHGYRYCNGTDPYRSIMSYPCTEDYTISRVNWFSNPDVELFDKPSGTADNDCARTIEEHMETVSEFRPVVEVVKDVNPCLDSTNSDYRCTGWNGGETVDLKRCSLTDADTDLLRSCFEVMNIKAITKIKLNVNPFTSLPYDLFDGIDSLATLNLLASCDLTCVPPVPSETTVHLSSCNSDIGTCEA